MPIIITTGNLNVHCEVIDTIFAIDSHKEGVFKSADPNLAFEGVKNQLKQRAAQLGGHAVISCQFEYRVAQASGMMGTKQVIEIFAYGTVVRFI
ncbi:heavy metal-binding domain-containing protein [Paenibacillus sp. IB182496]|uniref:Heavy metal-binding domain-containing protein n=1 Tax=Paenibacillus sabuli TaxID=2772509 RepID=A0A927BX18_9BACL|nr:heavy metal-binding domain-containing protein [Paenibacillus sabuli]MBD2847069.1 heavy metal-binding domain-containing protein [Paenibacillus sabuli]